MLTDNLKNLTGWEELTGNMKNLIGWDVSTDNLKNLIHWEELTYNLKNLIGWEELTDNLKNLIGWKTEEFELQQFFCPSTYFFPVTFIHFSMLFFEYLLVNIHANKHFVSLQPGKV